jgi:hypothetical protein
MSTNSKKANLIAALLEGAWRPSCQSLKISVEQLDEIAPMLLGSGAGPLGWRRVKDTLLGASHSASELRESYRLHSAQSLLYRHKIRLAFALLRANGIEPILIKGWASARLYPEAGLRPYGDIDLCVRPDDYRRAKVVMDSSEGKECWVDLHKGMGRLDNRSWDELFERSQLVKLDGDDIRVLGVEDHLRISCVHFLDHGAWRPIWLCDIAASVEAITADFDWDACLGKDQRRAKWIVSAIGLANRLLKARIEHCPEIIRNATLPGWLVPGVLKEWERPRVKEHAPPELIMISLRHPTRVPKAILNRWPNPIEATVRVKGSFNELPRLPFQLKDYLIQTGKFLGRLTRLPQSRTDATP